MGWTAGVAPQLHIPTTGKLGLTIMPEEAILMLLMEWVILSIQPMQQRTATLRVHMVHIRCPAILPVVLQRTVLTMAVLFLQLAQRLLQQGQTGIPLVGLPLAPVLAPALVLAPGTE